MSMSNLASAYLVAGKLDLAVPLLQETLQLRKAKFGAEHNDTLTSMRNLAEGYRAAGKLDVALPLFRELWDVLRKKHGANYSRTVGAEHQLGVCLMEQGKYEEAETRLGEALLKTLSGFRPSQAEICQSLVDLYGRWGRQDELSRWRAAWVATKQSSLGEALLQQKRYDEAEPLLLSGYEALNERKSRITGVMNARLLPDALARLVRLYDQWGKQDELGRWRAAYVATRRSALPGDPEARALELNRIGVTLMKMHGYAEAEDALREALTIREEELPDHWPTFNTRSNLGWALLEQKRYDEAEPLLLSGYAGLNERKEKITGAENARLLTDSLERLVRLYDARNMPEEAAKWRKLQTGDP